MSKINHERPSLKLKNSLLKSLSNQSIDSVGSIHSDKADYDTPPENLIEQNLEVNVGQIINAFIFFHTSWTANKFNNIQSDNDIISKKQKKRLKDSELLDERLYALALQFMPIVRELLINTLSSDHQKIQNINLWYNHLIKHLKKKYNVALQADAQEHLYNFCYEDLYKKVFDELSN